MSYVCKTINSPVGELKLIASDRGLAAILWPNDDPGRVRLSPLGEDCGHALLAETERQLSEYFAGMRTAFDLELAFVGTEFQTRVWAALMRIPFGETKSYGQIAQELGNPAATRAVGAANGMNPISIVVPCHRVIGASGGLTGFAGGLEIKAKLLAIEGRQPSAMTPAKSRSSRVSSKAQRATKPDLPDLFTHRRIAASPCHHQTVGVVRG